MKIDVLGTMYNITVTDEAADPRLADCDGYCDETVKEIVVDSYERYASERDSKRSLATQAAKVMRHEILHAFLFESGLAENSEWAQNEETVDWLATQIPKLVRAFKAAGCLES